MTEEGLSWEIRAAVCTNDTAAAMTSRKSRVVARIKAVNPKIVGAQCMLHTISNCIQSHGSRLLCLIRLWRELILWNQGHRSHVCWHIIAKKWTWNMTLVSLRAAVALPQKSVTADVWPTHTDVQVSERGQTFIFFSNLEWIAKHAYLADFNIFNLSMQGDYASILEVRGTINSFRTEIEIWLTRLQNGITDMFLDTNIPSVNIVRDNHHASWSEYINSYFTEKHKWLGLGPWSVCPRHDI